MCVDKYEDKHIKNRFLLPILHAKQTEQIYQYNR
jgi:hypothetical protein